MSDNATRLSPQGRAWVEQNLPRVKAMARYMAPRMPHASVDELTSAGYEGLVEAALRYDPESGVPFRAFAHYRIRGAMIDAARKASPALRRRNRALRALQASQALLEQAQKRASTATGVDHRSLKERVAMAADLLAQATTAVLYSKLGNADPDTLTDDEIEPADEVVLSDELREHLRATLAVCTPSDRQLIEEIYGRGRSMHEVADDLGVNVSTISRHHARLIARLGNILRARLRDPP